MIKKILVAFIAFFVCNAHAATYLDTENRLWFSADVVKNAIVDHVPDNKQQTVADLYQDLMEQETGKISIDSLFKVCRKAGFNTYKYDGFTQCRAFIQQMLTDAEVAQNVDLNGFCPGLDEKGNNPNKLRSITGETRIGDFCSSTNIYMGEVIFKPGYNCSCMAAVCNPGFEFQRGACVTKVADGNGNCLREAHKKTSENNYLEKCKSFCEKRYAGKACKYTSVVMSHSTGQCICNPNSDEVDAAYESMRRAEERLEQKKINNLKYYKVCDDDKGKTGGVEVCVEGVFNWVNVGRLQAVGLAQEYARVRYKDTIHCDTVNTDTRGNDDYVKCASTKSKRYYEFEFDDVTESIDSSIQSALVLGICKIHNVSSGVSKVPGGYSGALKCNTACTSEMIKTARIFGLDAKTSGNTCNFSGVSMTAEEAKSKLAKIDGIDNYIFFHGIQIQGSQNVVSQLRKYIESTGKTVRTFDCNKNVGEIKNSLLVGDDDVLRCTLNGQPIDFVFEDFSESWLYTQEVGESKVQCIVSGGKFSGQECYGLTQKQCIDANAKFLKQNPGASGFRWDGKECVSIDANEAQFYDGAIQVATGAVAVVDCVFGTKLGCVLVMVESAGLATEMTTGVAIENRAGKFLAVSTRCHARNCAINTIKNAGEVLSVMGALDETSLNSVDTELSRLVGYLEPEDLSGVSDGDWESIVTQLGGDPNDISGTALVTLNKIGLGLQFASIGISGLRLTALAIGKLAGKGSRVGRTTTAVARALDTSGDVARAANNITDAGRVADNASDVARTANVAPVSPSSADELATVGVREITDSRGRTLYQDMRNNNRFMSHNDVLQRIDELPSRANATVATNVATDASRATNNTTNVSRAAITPTNTSYVARTANTTTDATRATTNVATDGARTTNAATDASRTTNTATDAAHAGNYTSDAGRATNATADASRTANTATDAARTPTDIAKYDAQQIITESKNMTYEEQQQLLAMLSPEKKLQIAKLKVDDGEVILPYGYTIDDLSKNPDLLNFSGGGEFLPFDPELAKLQRSKRRVPGLKEVDDRLFEETVRKYVDNPSSKSAIEQYGQDMRKKYLDIFKENEQLRDYALRYDSLTKNEKARLGSDIVFKLKEKLGIPTKTNFTVLAIDRTENIEGFMRDNLSGIPIGAESLNNMLTELKSLVSNGYYGVTYDLSEYGQLIILNTGSPNLRTFDGFMTYLSHETGHAIQNVAPELTSNPQIMSQLAKYRGLETGDYMKNATEYESWNIQKIIGKDFTKTIREFR